MGVVLLLLLLLILPSALCCKVHERVVTDEASAAKASTCPAHAGADGGWGAGIQERVLKAQVGESSGMW